MVFCLILLPNDAMTSHFRAFATPMSNLYRFQNIGAFSSPEDRKVSASLVSDATNARIKRHGQAI